MPYVIFTTSADAMSACGRGFLVGGICGRGSELAVADGKLKDPHIADALPMFSTWKTVMCLC